MALTLFGPPPALPGPVLAEARAPLGLRILASALAVILIGAGVLGGLQGSLWKIALGVVSGTAAALLAASFSGMIYYVGSGWAAQRGLRGWKMVRLDQHCTVSSASSPLVGGDWLRVADTSGTVALWSLHSNCHAVMDVLEPQLAGRTMDERTRSRLFPDGEVAPAVGGAAGGAGAAPAAGWPVPAGGSSAGWPASGTAAGWPTPSSAAGFPLQSAAGFPSPVASGLSTGGFPGFSPADGPSAAAFPTPGGQPAAGLPTPVGQPAAGLPTPVGQPGSGFPTPGGQPGSGFPTPGGQTAAGASGYPSSAHQVPQQQTPQTAADVLAAIAESGWGDEPPGR